MRRLRLATLALASGVLVTLSGCTSTSSDSRMFPRLFHGNMFNRSTSDYVPECECQSGFMPPVTNLGTVQGPIMMPSGGMPSPGMPASAIPITNVPSPPPPPNIMRSAPAAATPYFPTLN